MKIQQYVSPETGEIHDVKTRLRIVDSREPWELQEPLIQAGWERQTLISGDYWMMSYDFKKVAIERKEIGDFLNSFGDRLSTQLNNMQEYYDICILLIEGSWKRLSAEDQRIATGNGTSGLTWQQVWNYLRSWQDKGVTLELTTSTAHTVKRVNEIYAYYQKPFHTANRISSGDERVMAFPSGCRGKTALNVLGRFGSLARVGNAGLLELQEVEGIGEKKANLIWNHFNIDKRIAEVKE